MVVEFKHLEIDMSLLDNLSAGFYEEEIVGDMKKPELKEYVEKEEEPKVEVYY